MLTSGTTHYHTEDRRRTWGSFVVPAPPAYTPTPLFLHSDPAKWGYILCQDTLYSIWLDGNLQRHCMCPPTLSSSALNVPYHRHTAPLMASLPSQKNSSQRYFAANSHAAKVLNTTHIAISSIVSASDACGNCALAHSLVSTNTYSVISICTR